MDADTNDKHGNLSPRYCFARWMSSEMSQQERLVRNLGDGVGMISMDTSQYYPFSSQRSLLVPCEMQLQKYQGL